MLSFCLVFVFHSLCYAPLGALFSELFPSAMRYTGVSMAYQVVSLIGGFGPLFATLLIGAGLSPLWVIGRLLLGLLVSITCALTVPRTDAVDLAEVGTESAEVSPVVVTPAVEEVARWPEPRRPVVGAS